MKQRRAIVGGILICGVVGSCGPEYPYWPPGTVPIVQGVLRGTATESMPRACLVRQLSGTPNSMGDFVANCVVFGADIVDGDCERARGFSYDVMTGRCVVQQIPVRQFNGGGTALASMDPGWYITRSTAMCQTELVFVGAAAPRAGETFEYECVTAVRPR